ncbi:hypothetical protein CXQ85_001056 [Candidozyma haemuli]|uniref:CN hydrolase domain-containing protein n=1 Tax=Candidozyma haemuli TaxID=45357 RepID=A0A2V1ALR2_9ASCO|nr:hypothetical protein CXQ85_001056 [[Candida] haemuloni]PVH18768.1 hypothetical protein CXQ85_001056 [[Candida] haemuloni]
MYLSALRLLTTSARRMTASKLTIACGQMCSSSDLAGNARVATRLIDQAVAQNVKVLFLPEAADYISRDASHSVQLAEESKEKFISVLQKHVRQIHERSSGEDEDKGIFVAVGVHEPASGDNHGKKVKNNQLWIDNRGDIAQTYQKLHLFDINIVNGPILKESNSVEPGKEILDPFSVNKGKFSKFSVGLAICYDIRFGELALRLRKLGANIITFPSAFTTRTGEAHWLELGKARAIDSQCYVVMAAQCGEHDVYADTEEDGDGKKVRVSYGQSVIIGPWGEVVAKGDTYLERKDSKDYSELIVGEIDLDYVEKIRTDLPVFTHRRPEIFGYEV